MQCLEIRKWTIADGAVRGAGTAEPEVESLLIVLIVIVAHAAFVGGYTLRRLVYEVNIDLLICLHRCYIDTETDHASVL